MEEWWILIEKNIQLPLGRWVTSDWTNQCMWVGVVLERQLMVLQMRIWICWVWWGWSLGQTPEALFFFHHKCKKWFSYHPFGMDDTRRWVLSALPAPWMPEQLIQLIQLTWSNSSSSHDPGHTAHLAHQAFCNFMWHPPSTLPENLAWMAASKFILDVSIQFKLGRCGTTLGRIELERECCLKGCLS
jgi:hypothetical protein